MPGGVGGGMLMLQIDRCIIGSIKFACNFFHIWKALAIWKILAHQVLAVGIELLPHTQLKDLSINSISSSDFQHQSPSGILLLPQKDILSFPPFE